MAGCTVAVALFIVAIHLLLKAEGTQCRGPKADNSMRHSACQAFMDDVMVMTPSIQGTEWILSAMEKMATEVPTIQDHGIRCVGFSPVPKPD